jgi:hypothetical protein
MARRTAAKYKIPPRLFLSMVEHESGWNPAAISPAGATGLGQLMPGTARTLKVDPFNPAQNLDGAARHLKAMMRQAGNWRDALRAYNQGYAGSQQGPTYGAEYADRILKGRDAYERAPGPGQVRARTSMPRDDGPGLGRDLTELARMLFSDEPMFLKSLQRPDTPAPEGTLGRDTRGGKLGGPVTTTTNQAGSLAPKTADWGGSKSIAQQMLSAMKASGAVVSSEKRSTKNTASGGISDHWEGSTTSYAFDVSGTEERMAKASQMLHAYLGLTHTPGQWTEVHVGGYRIQIGWKVPGHYDHVHFGVRKDS